MTDQQNEILRKAGEFFSRPGDVRSGVDLLIDAMGDDDWQFRKEAAEKVLECPDKTLLCELLVEALGEPDNVGRRNAVIHSVMAVGAGAIDPLLRSLKGKPEHRKVIVDVLGTYGEPRVLPALIDSLSDEDPNVRAAAMEQIASFPVSDVGPAFEQALNSNDLLVVLAALEGLNRQGATLSVERLKPLLDKIVLRPAVMTALGYSREIGALPYLLEGLLDRAKGAREAALVAVVRLHDLLSDPHDKHRVESVAANMSELVLREALRALMEANANVRAATATLLGWTRRRDMLRPLLLALRDVEPSVKEASEKAVLSLGNVGAEELCTMLPKLDGQTRAAVRAFFNRHEEELAARLDAALLQRLQSALAGSSN